MKKVLVTGSSGSVASKVIEMLQAKGVAVRGSDIVDNKHPGIEFMKGDLRKLDDCKKACEGIDTVFHIAAAPYSSPLELAEAVNVLGTKNIIEASKATGVKRIVFTSSCSVVFAGNHIVDGNEELPYAKPSIWFTDNYVQTKAKSERLILEANSPSLLTVAIRPHTIYGPQDKYLLPQMASKGGSLIVRMGSGDQLVSVSYVDNVAHAHILAAEALINPAKAKVVGGQAYNINDGKKVNFMTDVAYVAASELGGFNKSRMGLIPLPFFVLYMIAIIAELLTKPFGINITLNRLAITLICSNRSFSIAKAERDLGYKPIVSFEQGFRKTLDASRITWEDMQKQQKATAVRRPLFSYWMFLVASLSVLGVVQSVLSPEYIRSTQFANAASEITPLATRLFAYWTLINIFVRYALAINPWDKTLFRVAYLTFVSSLAIYVNEVFVQHTVPAFPQGTAPFVIASTTLLWMTFFPPKAKTA